MANIRLTGSPQAALLGGNVNIADLSLTPAFDLSSFIDQLTGGVEAPPSQGFTQNLALNLAVHSSNNVNLVSRTLSVGGSANLQVRGTVAEPVILGRANLTGGDIILHGNRFVLTGGTIQFVNPSMTQPVVNLTVTTSIQQYNISLRFEGPVDQLRTQYSSDPSLPSADIIHLLAFGQTTEASAANATPTNQAAETRVANQVRARSPAASRRRRASRNSPSTPCWRAATRRGLQAPPSRFSTRHRQSIRYVLDQRPDDPGRDYPGSIPGNAAGCCQRNTRPKWWVRSRYPYQENLVIAAALHPIDLLP